MASMIFSWWPTPFMSPLSIALFFRVINSWATRSSRWVSSESEQSIERGKNSDACKIPTKHSHIPGEEKKSGLGTSHFTGSLDRRAAVNTPAMTPAVRYLAVGLLTVHLTPSLITALQTVGRRTAAWRRTRRVEKKPNIGYDINPRER